MNFLKTSLIKKSSLLTSFSTNFYTTSALGLHTNHLELEPERQSHSFLFIPNMEAPKHKVKAKETIMPQLSRVFPYSNFTAKMEEFHNKYCFKTIMVGSCNQLIGMPTQKR